MSAETRPSPSISPAPQASAGGRDAALDIARALAVLGMILVNFDAAFVGAGPGAGGAGSWIVALISGRAAALFAVLAGVGIGLLAGRDQRNGRPAGETRRDLLARSLILLVAGFALLPLWSGDILHFYGVFIAATALLLTASTRWLVATIALLLAGAAGMQVFFDYEAGFQALQASAVPQSLAELGRRLFFSGYHPVTPWLAFLLLGVVLVRQRRLWRREVPLIAAGVALGAEALALLVGQATAYSVSMPWALFDRRPMAPTPLFMIASGATAVLTIGVLIRVAARLPGWLRETLAATGRLTLTIYLAHVLLGMELLSQLGLGERLTPYASVAIALLFYGVSALAARRWLLRYRSGPAEAGLRKLAGRLARGFSMRRPLPAENG